MLIFLALKFSSICLSANNIWSTCHLVLKIINVSEGQINETRENVEGWSMRVKAFILSSLVSNSPQRWYFQQLQLYLPAGTRILGDKYHLSPWPVSVHYTLLQTLDMNIITSSIYCHVNLNGTVEAIIHWTCCPQGSSTAVPAWC
jgi:hypothetical protein